MKNYWKRLVDRMCSTEQPEQPEQPEPSPEPVAHAPHVQETVRRRVEFVGGPLDGYRENIDQRLLKRFVSIPVCPSILSRAAGQLEFHDLRTKLTSVAIYELDGSLADAKYFFCVQLAPESIGFTTQ